MKLVPQHKKVSTSKVVFSLALGIIILIAIFSRMDLQQTAKVISQANFWFILMALIAHLPYHPHSCHTMGYSAYQHQI